MTFAVRSDVRFNDGRPRIPGVLRAGTFTKLDIADRQALSDWLDSSSGIDAVIDLALRPWNIAGASAILGIFEANKNQASWLIVRYRLGWTAARCTDGFISDVLESLVDVLSLIDEQRLA